MAVGTTHRDEIKGVRGEFDRTSPQQSLIHSVLFAGAVARCGCGCHG
ncbi:hypothetical protein KLMIMM195B_26070 [Klebsiella michiganensis]|nr:hypothetical protein AI2614V1_2266 [Klebsiella oxytoca]CAH3596755.1 hypothetical protein AI2614V1_2266 [Klebsiella oxytoca]